MKAVAAFLALFAMGCVSASQEAQNVRVTNNPDVVRDCKYVGSVTAMSGWGPNNPIGGHNVEETLKERAHKLGGDTVYIVGNQGSKGSGEAYRCGK